MYLSEIQLNNLTYPYGDVEPLSMVSPTADYAKLNAAASANALMVKG
jgi:hypothetical protein